jgi:hypothetical protein
MVELLTTELVVPAEETPAGAVWLSNLDLSARRGYTPTVYFYRTNDKPEFFEADAVKDSLARRWWRSTRWPAASGWTPPPGASRSTARARAPCS